MSDKPDLEDRAAHFAKQGSAGRDSTVLCEVSGSMYVPALDDNIDLEEILSAQKSLKEDKSTGDGWVKKMIVNLPATLLLVLQLIFNTILKCYVYPTEWRMTIVNGLLKVYFQRVKTTDLCPWYSCFRSCLTLFYLIALRSGLHRQTNKQLIRKRKAVQIMSSC